MQKLLVFDFAFCVVVTQLLINAKTGSSSSLIIKIILLLLLLLLQIKTIRAFFTDTDLLSSSVLTALRTSIVFHSMFPPRLRLY